MEADVTDDCPHCSNRGWHTWRIYLGQPPGTPAEVRVTCKTCEGRGCVAHQEAPEEEKSEAA